MNDIKRFMRKSLRTKLAVVFYPLLLTWRMPIAWFRSLKEALVLLDGRWGNYMGFHRGYAINAFFYRTQWLNIDKYGMKAKSPVVGLGDYPLSNWFHLTYLSSYIYSHAGAITTLAGTLIWVFSHLVWIDSLSAWWIVILTLTLFLSTSSYAMAFARQNYQILGWMWLPMIFSFAANSHNMLAGFALLAASFASITAVFFAIPGILLIAATKQSWITTLIVMPAVFKIGLHFIPMLFQNELKLNLLNTLKLIGASTKEVLYKRKSMQLDAAKIYMLVVYGLSTLALWVFSGTVPIFAMLGWIIYLINQRFIRVADDQSVIVLFLTLFFAQIAVVSPHPVYIGLLWFAASIKPSFLSISGSDSKITVFAPFDHSKLERLFDIFFQSVPTHERVLFSFNDPQGIYENIFDGFRMLTELPNYVAAKREINLMPDWYAVAETNYVGAPKIWGRSVAEVTANLERWKADYAIVYIFHGREEISAWVDEFEVISTLERTEIVNELQETEPWLLTEDFQFVLLKKK